MDCVKQINSLFSEDNPDSIINSQLSALDSRKSVKETSEKHRNPATTKVGGTGSTSERYPKEIASNSTFGRKPTAVAKPKVEPVYTRKQRSSKNMSDWGDEESTEVIGKGFGNGNEAYKSNDDYYQNGDDNNNDGPKKRFNGGRGGGGRGGGRGGGGFNRYNKDNYGEENGESNVHTNIILEQFQNPIFALTPKDFLQETLQYFTNNMPDLFRKATLVQKYTLMKYLIEAYERALKKHSKNKRDQKQPQNKKSLFRTEEKDVTQLQASFGEQVLSPPTLRSQLREQEQKTLLEICTDPAVPFKSNDVIDLLHVFQQDSNEPSNHQHFPTFELDDELSFQQNISSLPPPRMPVMDISDLFKSNNLSSSDDLELSCLRQHQPQQPNLPLTSSTSKALRKSERLQVQFSAVSCARERQPRSSVSATQKLLYSLRSPQSSTPGTQKRFQPRSFITEEEYSLRFRLPRRHFLAISSLPRMKCNIQTSSFAFFSMDMTLIEEEYFNENDGEHTASKSNLTEIQLIAPNPFILTLSTLARTGDNLSSVNVVRQAASSMMEMSSFGMPLLPIGAVDVSRIEEERSHGVIREMSPHVDNVNASMASNRSFVAAPEAGEQFQTQPQRKHQSNMSEEAITLAAVEPSTRITTDSGIHFPTPNLITTDSAPMIPSFTGTDSAPQTITRSQPLLDQPVSTDTGIFKTPIIPPYKLLHPQATSSSVEEHLFQSKLKNRTLDVSTPLSGLEVPLLQKRSTLLPEFEAETANVNANIANNNFSDPRTQQSSTLLEAVLQPIVEVRESNIRFSVQPSSGVNGFEDIAQNQRSTNVEEPSGQINPSSVDNNLSVQNSADDDYRKDWYEVLRARLQNANYQNATTPVHKFKHRRLRKRPPIIQEILQRQQLEQQTQNNVATSIQLQQTLAGILPPVSNASPKQNLNTTGSSGNSIGTAAQSACEIAGDQQRYDRFVLENSVNIATVIDNLSSCRVMLDNHRHALQAKLSAGTFQQPCQRFEPEVLLKATKKRLAVKLSLLQNIIRQVSFDFTKCDCIKDRMDAAIGFAFLLEMKSAGIINLSGDGRTVSLR